MDCGGGLGGGGGVGGVGDAGGGGSLGSSIVSGHHEGPRPGRWFGDGSWFAGRGGTVTLSTILFAAAVLVLLLV